MIAKRLLYIITQAPYSSTAGQEALDAALIGASFSADVGLMFLHDGVHQLRTNQQAEQVGVKPVSKAFAALADFEIERVYVHANSLKARGLSSAELMIAIKELDDEQVRGLIQQHDKVLTF